MGSSKKGPEAPYIPPQPPAQELMDIIDELAGIQTITVTDASGKKRRVTQRLPLTDEEKQLNEQATNLFNQALTNIQTLYNNDPSSVANYQPFIQAFTSINQERMNDLSAIGDFKDIAEKVSRFKKMNTELTMRSFDNAERMNEERLSRRGASNSSEANEQRAFMARERALLEKQVDVESNNYSEDLVNRQLEREGNLYALREEGRRARLEAADAGYTLERQKQDDLQAIRQNKINENMAAMDVASNVKGNDMERSRMGLANSQNAISMFSAQNKNQNHRYANEINANNSNFNNQTSQFSKTPASFRTRARDMGYSFAGKAAGRMMGKAMDRFGI